MTKAEIKTQLVENIKRVNNINKAYKQHKGDYKANVIINIASGKSRVEKYNDLCISAEYDDNDRDVACMIIEQFEKYSMGECDKITIKDAWEVVTDVMNL